LAATETHATTSNGRMVRLRARDARLRTGPELANRVRPPALAPRTARTERSERLRERLRPELAPRLESDALEPESVRRRDRRYRRLLGLADVLAMTAALAVCVPLLGEGDTLTPLVGAGAPLILLLAKVLDLYDRDELLLHKTTLDEAPKLFQVATLMALLLWLGHEFLIEGELGRKQVLGFWFVLAALLPLARGSARLFARRLA
jgi:hypothetical protein